MAAIEMFATATSSDGPAAAESAPVDPRIESLYVIANEWARGRVVSAGSVVSFATFLVSAIHEMVTEPHSGPYKKYVVLTVLTMVIKNIPFDREADRAAVLAVVTSAVPVVIDVIIALASDMHCTGCMPRAKRITLTAQRLARVAPQGCASERV